MESTIRVTISKNGKTKPRKPPRPLLALLGINPLREIISYLTFNEFLEFCVCCKKFSKFINDKFVKFQISAVKPIFSEQISLVEQILEIKSVQAIKTQNFPAVNIEWKSFPLNFFHYAVYDVQKFVFIHHENTVEVKEIISFSSGLSPIYSHMYPEYIQQACGYKSKIFILLQSSVEALKLDYRSEILNEYPSNPIKYSYKFPTSERKPKSLRILNSGKNVLLCFRETIYLLTDTLKLLNIHRFQGNKYSLHIPSKDAKSYIAYTSNEIRIFRINSSQETKMQSQYKISYLETGFFNKKPQIIYSNNQCEAFLNQKKLDIVTEKGFRVVKEFLVYYDLWSKNRINVLNLMNLTQVGSYNLPIYEVPHIIYCTDYKILYRFDNKIYMQSLVNSERYLLETRFDGVLDVEYTAPFMFISGSIESTKTVYGIAILDFYRNIEMKNYLAQLTPPGLPKKIS